MNKPFSLVLNATETAVLLLLNNVVLDVIDGNTSSDVIDELKAIQPNLEQILFEKEIPLTQQTTNHAM